MKYQGGIKTEKELNETETRNLSDKEFGTMGIRMLKDLWESFNKEIRNIRKEIENIKKEPVRNEECNN